MGYVQLPNGGCQYVRHYTEGKGDKKRLVVEYRQAPGMHTQALVPTPVPEPTDGTRVELRRLGDVRPLRRGGSVGGNIGRRFRGK
jgi:hypothetical protein